MSLIGSSPQLAKLARDEALAAGSFLLGRRSHERLTAPVAPNRALTAERILELGNKAYSLYLTRNAAEQAQLLKMVLLNCATDGANLWPNYRKPFDVIAQRAKNEEWSGREDLNLRPPGPEPEKGCFGERREKKRFEMSSLQKLLRR